MLTKTKKLFFIAAASYLLVIVGQTGYAIYDNLPVSKSNNYAFDYLFDMVQHDGANETTIGEIAIYYVEGEKTWHFNAELNRPLFLLQRVNISSVCDII